MSVKLAPVGSQAWTELVGIELKTMGDDYKDSHGTVAIPSNAYVNYVTEEPWSPSASVMAVPPSDDWDDPESCELIGHQRPKAAKPELAAAIPTITYQGIQWQVSQENFSIGKVITKELLLKAFNLGGGGWDS